MFLPLFYVRISQLLRALAGAQPSQGIFVRHFPQKPPYVSLTAPP